jgi:hypothetical protein
MEKAITEVEFLRKLQRLLNEGDFSATYKHALLNALADLSVEREAEPDGSLSVPLEAIAEKFIEYYWPQARPFRAVEDAAMVLQQNAGPQAAVVNELVEMQRQFPSTAALRATPRWRRLVSKVVRTITTMPLWKLQAIGSEVDDFLYAQGQLVGGCIRLRPGVPQAFRALHGLVLDAVRGAWVRQITRISANKIILKDADLYSFLFGNGRRALQAFARVLRDHQQAKCLYCGKGLRSAGDVDHFVAWMRYPVDLGHNLVLAHPECNARKRAFLAYPRHVESWCRSHLERAEELAQRFEAEQLPHDAERSRAVAWWAYDQGETAGAHAWIEADRLVPLDSSWRGALRPPPAPRPLLRVAEPPPSYDVE